MGKKAKKGNGKKKPWTKKTPTGDLTSLPPKPTNLVFHILRTAASFLISASTTQAIDGVIEFSLNKLSNTSELVSLFTSYRINAVEVTFEATSNMATAPTTAPAIKTPDLHTAIDYVGQNTTTDLINMRDSETYVRVPCYRTCARRLTPRFAVESMPVFGDGPSDGWLDTANTTVKHHGVRYLVDQSTHHYGWNVSVKYHISFKYVR